MKRLAAVIALAATGAALTVSSPAAATPTPCAAIAAQEPQLAHNESAPAPAMFAKDFPKLHDCEWGYPLGGFGGIRRGVPLRHVPVIFVHGNQVDAENWFLVRDQFRKAGYSDQELFALSYNGLENAGSGMPTQSAPDADSLAYWQANPSALANGGKGAADDVNVPDLYAFTLAVMAYTDSPSVDFVAHSLGVTIVRKMLYDHPELRPDVLAAVMTAGANHGTTICRGLDTTYYGCDEIAPGTPWLAQLNSAGEAPGPTHWLSVYNGADNADPFFQAAPGVFDDTQSPHLDGADANISCPKTYHNDLRVRPDIVQMDLDFILADGQSAAFAGSNSGAALQVPSTCTIVDQSPGSPLPEAPVVPLLVVPALALVGLEVLRRRRRSRA